MKNPISIFLVALIVFSCQDDNRPKLLVSDTVFSAEKNNATWSGTIEITLNNDTDTLTFLAIANHPNTEVLVFKIKFEGLGRYVLENNQALYYSTVGGDVITSEYKLAYGTQGELVVLEYDEKENIVKGTFAVSLIKQWSNPENNLAVLHFTSGSFKGEIKHKN